MALNITRQKYSHTDQMIENDTKYSNTIYSYILK